MPSATECDHANKISVCPDCKYSVCNACATDRVKGTCHCPASNFGNPYCDMKPAPHHATNNGNQKYTGPYKCTAQVGLEGYILQQHREGVKLSADACVCYNPDCNRNLTRDIAQRCGRCKSVVFCSGDCSKAAWKIHKRECGPYVATEDCPYIDREMKAYKQANGQYPGPELAGVP
eukprot:TRINITY_DN94612_c0_g1_i1.p1 TRINITY_DN94612_c0_g1~~TRINITY_DN94612_c0_g1_i1.p1  ORF type:complete len:183 (-),score=12.02 TRINITY_DN94612_c0_g1_i1:268-795(-)